MDVILVTNRGPRRSLYNSALWKVVRQTQRISWVDAAGEFGKHLTGIFRKRRVPKGKSTIMSSLQIGHSVISPLRRSRAWPFMATMLFPVWFVVCAAWFLATLLCYIPIVYFAFRALVTTPFRLWRRMSAGRGCKNRLRLTAWILVWLGNVVVLVFVCVMAVETADVIIHVAVYVVMGVVVNVDLVLPYVTLALLLLFYAHLGNVHVRRGYATVKDRVFAICRQNLVPDFEKEMAAVMEKEAERVESVLTTMAVDDDDNDAVMTARGADHLDLVDIVGEYSRRRGARITMPERKNYCHSLGGIKPLCLKWQRGGSPIMCRFVAKGQTGGDKRTEQWEEKPRVA